jgi:hypothetical protein
MRWVVIILIIAVSGVLGWFVASQSAVQQFLKVPVPTSSSGAAEPADPAPARDSEFPGESATSEPSDEDTPLDPPREDMPEPGPLLEPDPEPATSVPELEGEAALAQYRVWIGEARTLHSYPDSVQRMYDVMMCESGGQAGIVNPAGPYSGLFQYAGGTWNGDWNTYRENNILDPRSQIFATALAWSLNMQGQWGCYSSPH